LGEHPRALLFDLDGTLIDTAPEIAAALNETLAALALPPLPERRVRGWIGGGARALVAQALAFSGRDAAAADAAWPLFHRAYFGALGSSSRVNPGVREALAEAQRRGIALGVLTNKEQRFTERLLQRHGLAPHFAAVVCGDTLAVKKPDPAVVAHALAQLDAAAARTVLVGDSVTDVYTARAAGLRCWIVRGCYPGGSFSGDALPDRFFDSCAELLR
jgi:phosphoglycolate phosphatase